MTAIIGYAHDGKVTIGADSAQFRHWDRTTAGWPKVFCVGDMLIGVAGTPRLGQLIQRQTWTPDELPHEDEAYLLDYVVPKLQDAIKAGGFDWAKDGNEATAVLIGYHGALYVIEQSFSVHKIEEGMYGMGSGGDYALGALAAMERNRAWYQQEDMVCKALEIATRFSSACYAPFVVETIG